MFTETVHESASHGSLASRTGFFGFSPGRRCRVAADEGHCGTTNRSVGLGVFSYYERFSDESRTRLRLGTWGRHSCLPEWAGKNACPTLGITSVARCNPAANRSNFPVSPDFWVSRLPANRDVISDLIRAATLFVPAQFRPSRKWGAKLAGLLDRWRLRHVLPFVGVGGGEARRGERGYARWGNGSRRPSGTSGRAAGILPCPALPCPTAIADHVAAERIADQLLDQLGAIHAHHGRMDGQALRRFDLHR